MNDGARWQFYNNTHFPSFTAPLIALVAISPCPYPKDRVMKFYLNPSLSARFVISKRGSAPGDNINIRGVYASASLKAYSKLKGGGSMYYLPISVITKF